MRFNAARGLSIRNNEMEAPNTNCLKFATTKLGGAAGAGSENVEIRTNVFGTLTAISTINFSAPACIEDLELVNNYFDDTNASAAPLASLGNVIKIVGYGNRHGTGPGSASVGNLVAFAKKTLTYSASIAVDPAMGNSFVITATNNTAFTIEDPMVPYINGQRIVIMIRNSSGGVMGAITWGTTAYKMLSFTSPTDGNSCSIEFQCDGTNWVQITPQSLQIPN
jgi:hypothetical protein